MKFSKPSRSNIIFLFVVLLFIIPQTRQPIQVFFHKVFSRVNSVTIIEESKQRIVEDYNWILKDENGNNYNFKNTQGKVVIINFWATWCPPCIAEMPSLQKLYDTYNKDVIFLFVTNENTSVTSTFKNKKNYTLPVFQNISKTPDILYTTSIPRTVIIDKKGRIVIDKSGAVDWFSTSIKKEINKLLR